MMRYREFSRLDLAWTCRREIISKAVGICGRLVIVLISMVLLAVVFALMHTLVADSGGRSFAQLFFDHLSVEMSVQVPFLNETLPQVWVSLESMVGLVLSFVLAALVASVITKPINPLVMADRFVIHTDADVDGCREECPKNPIPRLEFRYHYRVPDGHYVYDASCIVEITTRAAWTRGKGVAESFFRYEEAHLMVRGVRFISIPFAHVDASDNCLKDALEKFLSSTETAPAHRPILRVRIRGTLASGQHVVVARVYTPEELANGYKYASIRNSTCTGVLPVGDIDLIYLNHFNRLYPCSNGPYLEFGDTCSEHVDGVLECGAVEPSLYDRMRNTMRKVRIAFSQRIL